MVQCGEVQQSMEPPDDTSLWRLGLLLEIDAADDADACPPSYVSSDAFMLAADEASKLTLLHSPARQICPALEASALIACTLMPEIDTIAELLQSIEILSPTSPDMLIDAADEASTERLPSMAKS